MSNVEDLPEGPPVDPAQHSSARPVRTEPAKSPPRPDDDDLAERAEEEEETLGVEDS